MGTEGEEGGGIPAGRHGRRKEPTMKLHRSLRVLVVLSVVLIVASSVFAGQRSVYFAKGTSFAGTYLPEGQYELTWKKSRDSDIYKVQILTGTRVVATAFGRLVDRGRTMEGNAVITRPNRNGTREIQEIQFRGKSTVLVIDS
jgi:hypothetical protein